MKPRTWKRWFILSLAVGGLAMPTAPLGATPVWMDSLQADTQTASIEHVIQQADQEQAQAIATGDPSVMADTSTSTPAHYRELVQINQQLLDNGVTEINLVGIEWGPITINGSQARVRAYETWTTTFADGSSTQSRDVNLYTLVQQGDTWEIQADQQPASGQPLAQPGGQNTSFNWAGYVATDSSFTGVTATWTVPKPEPSTARSDAVWVGVGGVTSRDLIQAGTQDVVAGSQVTSQAWIETLPRASRPVPLAVTAGDSVTVSLSEQGAGTGIWQIVLKNNSSGKSYQTSLQYPSSESSADWAAEVPFARGGIAPLTNFGSVSFSGASATINGQPETLAQLNAIPVTMIGPNGQALAAPTALGSDGSSFSITRSTASAVPLLPQIAPGVPNIPQPLVPFE